MQEVPFVTPDKYTEESPLKYAAEVVADQLRQLTHDRYTDTFATMQRERSLIALVLDRGDHVRIDVRGPVLQELQAVMEKNNMDDLLYYPPNTPRGTVNLGLHRETMSLELKTKEQAIQLATALAREASLKLMAGYIGGKEQIGRETLNPEMAAHIAAALIDEATQYCKELGGGKILKQLLEKQSRADRGR